MIRIPEPRRIIDPHALVAEIAGIARRSGGFGEAGGGRAAVVALLRGALDAGRLEIRRRFEGGAGGDVTVASGALLVDHLVRLLNGVARRYAYPLANPTAGERLALVALGGYGRRELAPQSDVDLLFLRAYKATPHVEQVVEYVLYGLWDIGLKVGHAVRSVDECIRLARADLPSPERSHSGFAQAGHVIRTSLLERHFVCGDRRPYSELERRFSAEVMAGTELEFVEAKLLERDRRHERLGDSRYVVEPNLKDGKGGLRDLHTLYWIAKYLYRVEDMGELVELGVLTEKEAGRFAKAQNFLLTLRSHLHYLTGRPGDVLTFDVQPEIGRRMGYTDHAGTRGVERFMKHYFLTAKAVGDLTRIFCAAIEAEHRLAARAESVPIGRARLGRFEVEGGRLTVSRDDVFERNPVDLIRLFHASLEHGLDIHPRALRLVTRNLRLVDSELRADPESNRLFLEILTSPKGPEATLRRMNEAGVFGRFVPDFGRVVAQMQHDMYHVYTVDEHTIRAIGILSRIERGLLREDHPLASEIVHKVLSRRVLYLGLLLHDIAKGRGGDHSDTGARIGRKLGPRLGLSEEETETVAWLVENHLLMSRTAFKRDLSDPKAIEDFVQVVQSPERLRLLLVLTVADIRAVGPAVWNGWKASLLRELYWRAEELLSGGLATPAAETRLAQARAALKERLPGSSEDALGAYCARFETAYWLAVEPEMAAAHARLVERLDGGASRVAIGVEVDRSRAVTMLSIATADRPGLFSRIAGAIAASGANIVDARIFTTTDGVAVDSFWVQEGPYDSPGAAFADPDRLALLEATVEHSVADEIDPGELLRGRRTLPVRAGVFQVAPRVLIDDRASATHTVIEVNGRDRPGLLYDLTRALADEKLQISSAKISTYGERVVDVFYVKDAFGLKVTHPAKLEQVRTALLAALAEPTQAAEEAVAVRPLVAATP